MYRRLAQMVYRRLAQMVSVGFNASESTSAHRHKFTRLRARLCRLLCSPDLFSIRINMLYQSFSVLRCYIRTCCNIFLHAELLAYIISLVSRPFLWFVHSNKLGTYLYLCCAKVWGGFMCCLHCLMVPFCIAAVWFPHDAFAHWDAGLRRGTREQRMQPWSRQTR